MQMCRWVVIAAALTISIVACSRAQSSAPEASSGEPIVVAARDLAQAYQSDRARADADFKGKRLRVSGVIADVRKSPGAVSVMLGAEGDPLVAECFFADSLAKQAALLAKGVRLTVDCDCEGFATTVVLRRCSFGSAAASSASAASDGKAAIDVCHKLEAAGIAAACQRGDGTGDSARFDLTSLPGKKGMVVRLADGLTFSKYVAGVAAQPPTSPLRPYYGSPTARIVVHLANGVTPDVEDKMKAVVDGL
jgi:hypothetical protein